MTDLQKIIITTIVVMLGWIVSHQLSSWRDRVNQRREQRVSYLIQTYRTLAKASQLNAGEIRAFKEEFELCFADLQYLGSRKQMALANEIIDSLPNQTSVSLDPLLYELRAELRKDLGRKPVSGPIKWVKIFDKKRLPNAAQQSP